MKLWHWCSTGLEQTNHIPLHAKPVVIICGGGFNVDDPSQTLRETVPEVERFFDFIVTQVATDKATFKHLICGDLLGKLGLNYFLIRKLLGLISAVPGQPSYPVAVDKGYIQAVDIFEISYSATSLCFHDTKKLYESTNYYSQDAIALARIIFEPLLRRHKNDLHTLCDVLQKITFFGISHGSNFLIELENAVTALLQELEFQHAARQTILCHIFSVAISSIAPAVAAKGSRFTSIYFEGINDKLAQWINPYKIHTNTEDELIITELADNRLLVLSHIVETASRWDEIIPQFDYFWINNDKAAHYTPFYTLRCQPENIQPELIERVLRNAVQRYKTHDVSVRSLWKKAPPFNDMVFQQPCSPAIERILSATGYG